MEQAHRNSFRGNLRVDDQIVQIDSVLRCGEAELSRIVDRFNQYGFVILRCADKSHPRENLLALKPLLGNPAHHARADRDGVVSIDARSPQPGFAGSTAEEHLPHTDGSFSERPERILTLQCVEASSTGGVSNLGCAIAALNALRSDFSNLEALTEPTALSVTRRGEQVTKALFFYDKALSRFAIRFRMNDGAAIVVPSEPARDFVTRLCAYFTAPENQVQFNLRPGDILITDNTSTVHGRSAFPANSCRQMNRLNFDGMGILRPRLILGVPQSHLSSTAKNVAA